MLEGFRVRNYRALKDITLGRLQNQAAEPLTPLSAVIGKNGSGKSTLLDAFRFVADTLNFNSVATACERRGGVERLVSQGTRGGFAFDLHWREPGTEVALTYELGVGADESRQPVILHERVFQHEADKPPTPLVNIKLGRGTVGAAALALEIEGSQQSALAAIGPMVAHPKLRRLLEFIRNWHISEFAPSSARHLPPSGPQRRLNSSGDNLGNVVEFLERENPRHFKDILRSLAKRIPGVRSIKTTQTPDGRVLLQFNNSGFKDPFYSQQMSDGTLKVFAYMLMLADPEPPPFICIEEPENGLYHKLLDVLVAEFRKHASQRTSQVFLTTHQPYLVDALAPDETWILEKGANGFSTIRRASDDPIVRGLVEEGLPLGGLWFSDYLDKR